MFLDLLRSLLIWCPLCQWAKHLSQSAAADTGVQGHERQQWLVAGGGGRPARLRAFQLYPQIRIYLKKSFILRLYFDLKKAHSASRRNKKDKRASGHTVTYFWSVVKEFDSEKDWLLLLTLLLKVNIICLYLKTFFILFVLTGNCTLLPLVSSEKPVNCTRSLPYSLELKTMNCMFKRTVLKVSALGDCNGNVNVLGLDWFL